MRADSLVVVLLVVAVGAGAAALPGPQPGETGSPPPGAIGMLAVPLWTAQLDGIMHGAAAASDGSVVVVGSRGSWTQIQTLVEKWIAPGSVVWSRTLGFAQQNFGQSVATNAAGDIVVAGRAVATCAPECVFQPLVAKYDALGNPLWVRTFDLPRTRVPSDVAFDSGGNVLVAGTALGAPAFAFVLKLDPQGRLLYDRFYDAPFAEAFGVAAAGAGEFVLTGTYRSGPLDNNGFVARFDAAGNVLWSRDLDVAQYDEPRDVAADAFGISVAGYAYTFEDPAGDAFAARLDHRGKVLWANVVERDAFGFRVATDGVGDAFITGWRSTGGGPPVLIKVAGSGERLWAIEEPSGGIGVGIAVDALGNPATVSRGSVDPSVGQLRRYLDLSPDVPAYPCRVQLAPVAANCSL